MAGKKALRGASAAVAAAVMCLALAACGDDEGSNDSAGAATSSATTSESPSQSEEPKEPKKVAYLMASSANTWLQASRTKINEIAEANNIEVVDFDAQFKLGEQGKQVQDIIASKQYDGIIIASVDGAGVIPDLQAAIDAGIKVAILNQIVGDKLDTADPQFDGPVVSVLAPPLKSGERLGKLTNMACENVDPCRVVYFFGIKGSPVDTAIRQGFDDLTGSTTVEVVAEGEGKYLGPDEAMKGMQDILQKTSEFEVVVGPDQAIQGVQLALQDAGKDAGVKLIGFGGSEPAVAGVADGSWFGDVFGAPVTEAELMMNALLKAFEDDTVSGGIDPGTELPDEGLVTQDNVDKFQAQWAG